MANKETKPTRAEKRAAKAAAKAARGPRFKVIRDAYQVTKRERPQVGLILLAIFVAVLAVGITIGAILGSPIYATFVTTPLAFLIAFIIFTRMATSAAYSSIEGQVGAAASVLMSIRKGWTVDTAVNVNRNQDMVHRAVGKPGIVLVGEGREGVKALLNDERRRMERVAPGVPVNALVCGEIEGQVSVRKLQRQMKKYPKKLSMSQVRELRARIKSVGGMNIPLPKGPMPRNIKLPKRP
jgi:F0F1-type ATP synthase assembly protein I